MLKQHFDNLSKTERHRLLTALAVALLLIAYLFIWQPAAQKNEKLKTTLEQKAQLLSWMQESAAKVKATGDKNQHLQNSSSLQQLISRQARRFRLNISRLQATSSGRVQLQVEQGNFEALLRYIAYLSSQGAVLEQLTINRTNNAGKVSARLTFGVAQ